MVVVVADLAEGRRVAPSSVLIDDPPLVDNHGSPADVTRPVASLVKLLDVLQGVAGAPITAGARP